MTRRLVATYLALAAVVLIALEVPLGIANERGQRRDLQQRVERDAVALAALVEDTLSDGAAPGDPVLARIASRYGATTGARVVVTGPGGRALADSDAAGRPGRDFSTRPEIAVALEGEVATGTRRSDTLGTDLLYVAVPVASGGAVRGAVRVTVPTSRVDALVRRYWLVLGGVAVVVLLAVALAGLWLARWVSRPLTDLRDAADAVGSGDLSVRADPDAGPDEVRAVAGAVNDMVARLADLMEGQARFVADASHQLRSPLTALRLRIENLQHEADPAATEDLGAAVAEVDRLSRLVDALLTLARAERAPEERSPQDVGASVRSRADAWRPAAADRRVEIVAAVEGAPTALLGPGALEQVLDNLLSNALAVAPRGSTVRIEAARAGDAVIVDVIDRGPGMTAAERERAFDRFWRGGGERPGSGLGLAIVRGLVEADGGTATLDAGPDGGLRARIRLPAVAAAAPAGAVGQSSGR